jgi:2-iminobutanoate/2-iminopropanoate deaminase
MKKSVNTKKAPAAIGPYSQAVKIDNILYVSGQLPIDPKSGKCVNRKIADQTKRSLSNIKIIREEAGYTMDDVVKSTVYLDDMDDFPGMNEIYMGFFSEPYPARVALAVKTPPKNALVEKEVVAYK